MAKFGQGFIQSLTQPGYSQGMFELGTTLGQAPAVAKEREAKKQRMDQLGSALKSDDPAALERVGSVFLNTANPEVGTQLLSSARTLRQTQARQSTASDLSSIQQRMVEVFKGPATPEVKKQQADALQQEAMDIVRNDPFATPEQITSAGSLSMRTEGAVFQQAVAKNQETRAQGTFERSAEAFKLTQEQMGMAREKHEEWVNSADHRVAMQVLEQEGAQYQQATRAARAAVGQPGGKEAFNARYPNMSGIWDAVSTEKDARDLQVDALRTAAEAGEFTMTAAEVAEMFNAKEDSAEVQSFMKLAKSNPKNASTMIANKIASDLSGPTIPKATVVEMFKDQAMVYATYWRNRVSTGWLYDTDEEEEAAAAEMAVKAAEVYQKTGSYSDAIDVFPIVAAKLSGKTATKDPEQVEPLSELDELRNDLLAFEAERQKRLEEEKPLSGN